MGRPFVAEEASTKARSSITADYHQTLLLHNRKLGAEDHEHDIVAPKSTRSWIPKRPNTSGSGRGTAKSSKKNPGTIDTSEGRTVSRQDLEDFQSLPMAVRRKVSRHVLLTVTLVITRAVLQHIFFLALTPRGC
jgi:hypothetical protein